MRFCSARVKANGACQRARLRAGIGGLLLPVLAIAGPLSAQTAPLNMQTASPAEAAPAPSAAPAGSVSGMGDVNIFPKRLVIDGKERLATLGLYNRSTAPGDYDIGIKDMAMTTAGNLVDVAPPGDQSQPQALGGHSAASLLRWSPRRVSLQGSEAQSVHVMVRIPPDLPPGEYRSHFTIVSVPPLDEGLTIDQATGQKQNDQIGVRIVPRFGISVPVIVRVGETTLSVGMRQLAVTGDGAARKITVIMTREGTRSAFGDVAIYAAGQKTPLAELKGIGIYTEVGERRVDVPVDPKVDPRLLARGARLTVTYTDDDVSPGKTLARQEFIVP